VQVDAQLEGIEEVHLNRQLLRGVVAPVGGDVS
jgi:hypothetical protein